MRARRTTGRRTALLAALALAVTGLGAVQVAAGGPASAATGARGVTPVAPTRIADTRSGIGGVPRAPIGPGGSITFLAAGSTPEIPSTGVAAVLLNISAVSPTANGSLVVYATGSTRPAVSSVSLVPGVTITNLVVAKVGTGGQVTAFNSAGNTHVVVDVTGWIPTGGEYTALPPQRLMDTRTGVGAPKAAVGPGGVVNLQVTGRGGVPAGAAAVVLVVTGIGPSANTPISVYPTGTTRSTATALNLTAGRNRGVTVVARVGTGGKVTLWNGAGTVNLVADVVGSFATGTQLVEQAPYRLVDTRSGIGAPKAPLAANGVLTVTATLAGGVALPDSQALLVTVTAVRPVASTVLAASPVGFKPDLNSMIAPAGVVTSNTVLAGLTRVNATTFRFQVANGTGATDVIVDVQALVAPELTITTPPLPSGRAGVAYSQQLSTTGGTAPYTYDVVDGSLPPGLTLSPSGLISGTPTAISIFPFRVRARDDASHTGALYQRITINP